jgi:D-alanyl-D-alanine carboxypeptidase
MTRAWSMQAHRRRRRPVLVRATLAGLLAAVAVAGVVATTPGGISGLVGLAASNASPSPGASASPGTVASPAAAIVPGASAAPAGASPPGTGPGGSPSGSRLPSGSGSPGQPSPDPAAEPIAVIPQPAAPPVDAATAATLQKALDTARRSMVIPGVAATVILPDGRTWTGVAGDAVAATHLKVTPETPFAIASVTKTFTAALILRLAEKGRLTIDDRLARWLPDYPNAARITLRMLLQHTSGLADFFQNPKFDAAMNRAKRHAWLPDEVLPFVAAPAFPPGTGWGYSNTNYVLLGMVAERAGGAPWAEQVRREFIVPLGLASTYVQGIATPDIAAAHANVMFIGSGGHILPRDLSDGSGFVPFTAVATAAFSAGSIASTTGDMARWARALYGTDLLTPPSRRAMLTFDPNIEKYAALAYGLGVSRVKIDGRFVAFGHTGALAGTRAAIRWLPKEQVSVAVAFNRDLFTGDDVVRQLIAALYPRPKSGASPGPSSSPGPSASPGPTAPAAPVPSSAP